MAKVQMQKINKRERYVMIGEFYDIVTNLTTKKEVVGFFMGLLTPSEALMFARRIQIAQMLIEEKNYDVIREDLGVGHSTIASVARWLNDENDCFQKQIKKHITNKKRKQDDVPSRESGGLLDRYPGHRLLKDLFK